MHSTGVMIVRDAWIDMGLVLLIQNEQKLY